MLPLPEAATGKRKRDRRHAYLPYTRQDGFESSSGGSGVEQRRQALLLQQKLAEVTSQQTEGPCREADEDEWIAQKLVCLKPRMTKSKGCLPPHEAPLVQIHVSSSSLNRSPFLAPASRKRKRQVAAVDAVSPFICQQCSQVVWLKYGDYFESCQRCGDCMLVPQP
eukprot:Protomagalhaensia_wolfi_Nauph_80__3665@NODE_36_length_4469_cov_116_886230_g28_i0_p3_GENE_NODE_36_length_4469_cov_116_886230_g28_i0NODE_36_length_4469_cov_116_886230_g28_i0_p3_ORF_typecomplete_len166_score19_11DUF4451/PF14616_6/0_011DUF1451/PF07295_11/0_17zfCSL/PF05207_13/8_2zfCSL/PF05207_13/29_NODE_36_length_4469_cov_116_886230_g28_i013911888